MAFICLEIQVFQYKKKQTDKMTDWDNATEGTHRQSNEISKKKKFFLTKLLEKGTFPPKNNAINRLEDFELLKILFPSL